MTTDSTSLLTIEQVRQIAELANIHIEDQDLEKYGEQISEILAYFQKISEVDTDTIEVVSHLEVKNVESEDNSLDSLSQDEALKNRQGNTKNGYFIITSVLNKNKK